MDWLTITAISTGLRERLFSATELTRQYLDRIAGSDAEIGAYLHVMGADALATAKRAGGATARG